MNATTAPTTLHDLRRFLVNGAAALIGPMLAARLLDHFGQDIFQVLNTHPERLREVEGFGPKRCTQLRAAWAQFSPQQSICRWLEQLGLSVAQAVAAYGYYGETTREQVRAYPYDLIERLDGVGFETADAIAQKLGMPRLHSTRLHAGLVETLRQYAQDGHVFAPEARLIDRATKLLNVPPESLLASLNTLPPTVHCEQPQANHQPLFYLTRLYKAEVAVAQQLNKRLAKPESHLTALARLDWAAVWQQDAGGAPLSAEQRRAVQQALTAPICILTGGPGTGKSVTLAAVLRVLKQCAPTATFMLAAPTGRAAQRLTEATGHAAQTLHRLLDYHPDLGFGHDAQHPLAADLVIVDEVSMLDLPLFAHLLDALAPRTHLLLVGDVDQLPSIGPGQVLRDLLKSRLVPVARLTQVFRQAQDSGIVTNAHRVRLGQNLTFNTNDFRLCEVAQPEAAANEVVALVQRILPAQFHLDPMQIQVLTAMRKGPVGVEALNVALQAALNPPHPSKAEQRVGKRVLRVGDRVMQTVNDYDRNVFNGDLGIIIEIDPARDTLTVQFGRRQVKYKRAGWGALVHAYAMTIHKAQGAEFQAVVVPLLWAQKYMLRQNLLYTAITRAKQVCALVGSPTAIQYAISNKQGQVRWSRLSERLCLPTGCTE